MSDSHGKQLLSKPPAEHIDVAIHCGDLTQESKLDEFKTTLRHLQDVNADLKLVIAGNHDFTLDVPAFESIVRNTRPPLEPELVRKTYGDYGEVRNSLFADWGFQYHPREGHRFDIPEDVDVVITHGPPKGILDYTGSQQRAGCPHLFQAIAYARPRLHCFGHIHEGWGGKLVTWRRHVASDLPPSHFTHIDHARSTLLGSLAGLSDARQDRDLDLFTADYDFSEQEPQTLFLNVALQGTPEMGQIPWVTKIPLPRVKT
uniref:Metallophosphoesterase domain-containing protein 1 n=1 Tax=Talaromyces marneffei PM1 TaxID=1077442 RepID=A0A093V919_TALMA